jgi:VCBS repeat-containing protein
VLTSAPTAVTINVTNTAPTAVNQTYGISENTTVNVTAASGLLKGASDADGDTLTASLVAGSGPSHGTVTVNADGSFTYTPAMGYIGGDGFQYAVSDGVASTDATVTLNIHADSSNPTAGPASYSVQHDQTLTETAGTGVLAYASDSDGDPLTASEVSGPSDGTLTLNSDGSFTYTPNAHWIGTDSFQYDASDGANTSAAATVTINVTNTGTPVANADSYSIERNNEFSADASTGVLSNDSDSDGDSLTAVLASNPSNGTLTFNSDGSFDYTPDHNFTGTDTFTYEASDGVSTSSPATVTLTVSASPPQAIDDAYDVLLNKTLNIQASNGVLANDYDPDNLSMTAQLVTQPADGSLTLNSDGSFTYTPNNNFKGTDSFTYEAIDSTGLTSNLATVTIDVRASDSPPTVENQQYTVSHNGDLIISGPGVLAGASDPNGQPLVAVLNSDVQDGYLTLNPDGSFEYAPDWNFVGNDSFTYYATDGLANSAPATVTIDVTDQAPVLTSPAPSFSVTENGSLSEDQPVLLSGAYDADGDGLMTTLVSGTSNGTLSLQTDGTFTYEPNTSFIGTDSFTYEITDGLLNSSPITGSIQVQAGSPFQLDGRDAGSGTTWMSDTDAENDGIYVSASDPNPAALLAHATGNSNYQRVITWDPSQLSITAPDGSGGSSGSLILPESDGNVQLTVVPVSQFAPGQSANISMAVQNVQTGQQVALLNVKAVQEKMQVTQLSFTSDQGLMRFGGTGKKPNLNFSGALLGPVQYRQTLAGTVQTDNPVSQQANQPIQVTLTLTANGVAAGTPYTLTGTSKDDAALTFSGNGNLAAAGQYVTASAATKALDGSIREIQGSITWTLILNPGTPQAETIDLKQTGKHRIYTTLGTPNTTASGVIVDGSVHAVPRSNPAAVTETRMALTVKSVSDAIAALKKNGVNNPAPSQIVWQLMGNLGNFNLKGNPKLFGVGAWGVANANAAQCFSMAEFVSLVAWMTGVPGTVTPTTYYALPANPNKALVGTLDNDPNANVIVPVQGVGNVPARVWLIDDTGGFNNFEGAVMYNYTDPKGKNKTVYFPAGVKGPPVLGSPDDVLKVFETLSAMAGNNEVWRYTKYPALPPNLPLP